MWTFTPRTRPQSTQTSPCQQPWRPALRPELWPGLLSFTRVLPPLCPAPTPGLPLLPLPCLSSPPLHHHNPQVTPAFTGRPRQLPPTIPARPRHTVSPLGPHRRATAPTTGLFCCSAAQCPFGLTHRTRASRAGSEQSHRTQPTPGEAPTQRAATGTRAPRRLPCAECQQGETHAALQKESWPPPTPGSPARNHRLLTWGPVDRRPAAHTARHCSPGPAANPGRPRAALLRDHSAAPRRAR